MSSSSQHDFWTQLERQVKRGRTHPERRSSLNADRRQHGPCLPDWCLCLHHQSVSLCTAVHSAAPWLLLASSWFLLQSMMGEAPPWVVAVCWLELSRGGGERATAGSGWWLPWWLSPYVCMDDIFSELLLHSCMILMTEQCVNFEKSSVSVQFIESSISYVSVFFSETPILHGIWCIKGIKSYIFSNMVFKACTLQFIINAKTLHPYLDVLPLLLRNLYQVYKA